MTAYAQEQFDSREISKGKAALLKYKIFGTATYTEALSTMETQHGEDGYPGLNLGQGGLSIKNIRRDTDVKPIYIDTGNESACLWEGEIKYRLSVSQSFNEDVPLANWSFDFGASTQKVTQSSVVVLSPAEAPDFNRAIEYDGQKINGADIIVPEFRFGIKVVYDTMSLAKAGSFAEFVGKTNSVEFQGFAAECVLCLPPTGGQDTRTGNWVMQHNFAYKPKTPAGTEVGDISTTADIPGWYHIWPYYEEDTDDVMLTKKPVYVYGSKVYDTIDFNTIPGFSIMSGL